MVLKIIKHCHEALPGFVTGQLLGLDIGRTLEVTNCFAFPTKDDDAGGGGKGDGDDDEDGAEYQIEMMRSLREVNVDNNTVGWYQSTYFSSFIDDSCIETQFNYQENIENRCVIIYDPSRARRRPRAARFRLTDAFMAEYKEGKFAATRRRRRRRGRRSSRSSRSRCATRTSRRPSSSSSRTRSASRRRRRTFRGSSSTPTPSSRS